MMAFSTKVDPNGVFAGASYIKAVKTFTYEHSYDDPIPMFRREFVIDKEVKSAEIFVQSPGFAEYRINGQLITEDIFISATSDYKKILWYDTYDVSPLLKKGKNVITVMTGNGFFNENVVTDWLFHNAYWRDAPQFILSLKINGEVAVVSDSSWKANRDKSYITYSQLRSGEFVDMRKYSEDWMQVGYDDSDWTNAIERPDEEITGELRPIICQPVRELEVFHPTDIRKTEEGYLVDFGRTSSGYMEITIQGERGRELEFQYTEDVYPDGKVKMNNLQQAHCFPGHNAFHLNKMILSGGVDTFKPKFCYHGYRYVCIKGLDAAPDPKSIKGYFIHNDVKKTGEFKCGNEIIQFIYDAGARSVFSNLFWALTDCPTREKMGWMNDARASTEQTLINYDILPFYKKWFEDIKADMHPDGALNSVIPGHPGWGRDWGPVCDLMLYELPYRVYLYTGDSSMLTGAISHFERYIDFLEGYIKRNENFILADWQGWGNSPLIPLEFVRNISMLNALEVTSLARRLAGLSSEDIDNKLAYYKDMFIAEYLDEDGRCTIDEQTSVAMMIMHGLYTNKEALLKQIAETVERTNCTLTAGMLGVQYLYDALGEAGRGDLAYRLITESDPGYKSWYDYGADTLWECWNGRDLNSHNHHMFSNVIGWFFKTMLGIEPMPEYPGFEKITLRPQFIKDAKFAKGKFETIKGTVELGWEFKGDDVEYTVVLPEGIDATYDGKQLSAGKNTFVIKK
ncbi:MAG: family 78 glycoside hydrolase catalytic domain [Clostridia bacterium]|nr:family 78 glycoside hydrolase catalytic domain [Clostridia bacterium]